MIGNRPEKVEYFLERSLKNLRTSYVDLYFIHFPVGFQFEDDETFFPKKDGRIQLDFEHSCLPSLWRAMENQVKDGRARAIGVSNFSARQIDMIMEHAEVPPATLQVG